MKRRGIIFISALVVLQLCCSSLWARPTTVYEAEMVVTGWLKADARPLGTALGPEVMMVETFTDDYGEPVYYIVYLQEAGPAGTQPSGFVIVSADDLVEPIIGFADDGIFDPSLDNPLGALVTNDLNGRIAAARATFSALALDADPAVTQTQSKWNHFISLAEAPTSGFGLMGLTSISDIRVAPLVQSKWAQRNVCDRNCYNYYTPNNYPCGCGATAMAQLMRYHQHPAAGIGINDFPINVDGVEQTAFTRGGDGNGGSYKWDLMVLEPDCSTTLQQRQAIGALCYDAGVAVTMEYSADRSGTNISRMASALRSIFKYNNSVRGTISSDDAGAGLRNMANSNLDAENPVIFRIWHNQTELGHFVVCDGYGYNASALYHHFNMGSRGNDDAWYNLPDIEHPSFNVVTHCIYNIFTFGSGEIISGRVTDISGNPVSGATVAAQDSERRYTAVTNSKGIYALVGVNSGSTYTVSVAKSGYYSPAQVVTTGTSTDDSAVSGNKWGIDFEGDCTDVTIGSGTSDWEYPMNTGYGDSRTQAIYLASEIGRSGTITKLALYVTKVPGQTMNNWTIRMQHTSMSEHSLCLLYASDWTVVYQSDETVAGTGWRTFEFQTPFEYNGTDNLLVDFSHNNSSSTSHGKCRSHSAFFTEQGRGACAHSDSQHGDPLNWSGPRQPTVNCTNMIPNVKLTICRESRLIFEDTFTIGIFDVDIDRNKWPVVDRAWVDDAGINEPSGWYSLRLNGCASVESKEIDLNLYTDATLTYCYQRTGGGSSPEKGDDLIIEYWGRGSGGLPPQQGRGPTPPPPAHWIELARHPGEGPDMTIYEPNTIALPSAADFRFRIRTSSSSVNGDWFVDNVRIVGTPRRIPFP